MTVFHYQDHSLFVEELPLSQIAEQFGTPCFVYSRQALQDNFLAYENAFSETDHLICYAVKANSNLAVLGILAKLGAGFDIVSGGELERVIRAGGDPGKVIFSGLGKTQAEISAALQAGILCFNIESEAELLRINDVAQGLGMTAPVSLRVNPDVDAGTHPYISTGLKENKFGIDINRALSVYEQAATLPGISIVGIDCHIGSQLTTVEPFLDAVDRVLKLVDTLAERGISLKHIDVGGGLGVTYRDETPPDPSVLVAAIQQRIGERALSMIMEPGRSIAANAGVMLTRVEFLKPTEHKNFAIVDGAMNDLIRPSLYSAWQDIVAVDIDREGIPSQCYDVVGPVCESGDFLGKNRDLAIVAGDLLAVKSAGAYGFVMSSNYNTRNRAAEVMVDGAQSYLVRKRETLDYQLSLETVLPE